MRIMTNERCPSCTQIIFIEIDGKIGDDGKYLTINGHGIAANVYLDQDGILNVVETDLDSHMPSYHCHFCGWSV